MIRHSFEFTSYDYVKVRTLSIVLIEKGDIEKDSGKKGFMLNRMPQEKNQRTAAKRVCQ